MSAPANLPKQTIKLSGNNAAILADLIRPGAGRGLDFVILDELRKRTGISPSEIHRFAVGEMLANSLDTNAIEIYVTIKNTGDFDEITVKDNGSKKIGLDEVELILDFLNKASSKRGFLRVSRGYLGNALKCLFGYSYALADSKGLKPPDSVVYSHGVEYRIRLIPDVVREVIGSKIVNTKIDRGSFNAFTICFPAIDHASTIRKGIYDVIFASSMVNPTRRIHYDLWDSEGDLGEPHEAFNPRRDTSVLWYKEDEFVTLFFDFIRVAPETQLREFLSLFRGFTGKKVQREILQEISTTADHDPSPQFFPATKIRGVPRRAVKRLFNSMAKRAKPISKRSTPKVLGAVGEEHFEKIKERYGWRHLKYTIMKGRKETYWLIDRWAGFPFLVELAVFDRNEDGDGLKVFQCVNFMASMEDIFSKIFNIKYRLGRVGIKETTPVTVLAHLVCPVLKWLNYGKSGLYE